MGPALLAWAPRRALGAPACGYRWGLFELRPMAPASLERSSRSRLAINSNTSLQLEFVDRRTHKAN